MTVRIPQARVKVLLLVTVCLATTLNGCDSFPKKVEMSDPRIQPLLSAAATFDRSAYGFTPIPQAATVRWESKATSRYDAMLHIDSKTSRTIAFRKAGASWRWIGDQETFRGPRTYKTVDGTLPEQICLTYETENVSGYPTNRLNVTYWGEDSRLVGRRELTLADVKPVLKGWGY